MFSSPVNDTREKADAGKQKCAPQPDRVSSSRFGLTVGSSHSSANTTRTTGSTMDWQRKTVTRPQFSYSNQALLRTRHQNSVLLSRRSCGCSGTGQGCQTCQGKEESPKKSDTNRVAPPRFATNSDNPPAQQLKGHRQLGDGEQPSDGGSQTYSSDGLLLREQGSGTCVNGGASSGCDPSTGIYALRGNSNTCCTKDCSRDHEQQHVNFETSAGCCKALSAAWNVKGSDHGALIKKYNKWVNDTEAFSECQAYTNDVKCSTELAKTKDCDGAGKGTDCCKDIEDYKTRYAALAKTYCGKAPKNAAPCPSY